MIARRVGATTATRIALVADSHGVLTAGLVADLTGVDLILHAGDVGSAGVLRELRSVAAVHAVAGNNDVPRKWPPGEASVCQRLPAVIEVVLNGGTVVVVHGHQWPAVATRHQRLRALFPTARCIVYGHSHRRVIDTTTTPWVINPGACGRARTHDGPGWLGLTIAADDWAVTCPDFSSNEPSAATSVRTRFLRE